MHIPTRKCRGPRTGRDDADRVRGPAATARRCRAGPPRSTARLRRSASHGSAWPGLRTQGMTFTVRLPKGVVPRPTPILEERFNVASAFRVTPGTGGYRRSRSFVALVGVVLLGLADRPPTGAAQARRSTPPFAPGRGHGAGPAAAPRRDAGGVRAARRPAARIRSAPSSTSRPNPLDVTATIIDLAVRGYLKIEEVAADEDHPAGPDWTLTKLKATTTAGALRAHAARRAVPRRRRGGASRTCRYEFADRMHKVAEALIDDATDRRWFAHKPVDSPCRASTWRWACWCSWPASGSRSRSRVTHACCSRDPGHHRAGSC